jgi:hypothetical protein
MSNHQREQTFAKVEFGPPPVLSSEDPKQFEEMFARVIACLEPRDTVEFILIRHFVYALWEIERFTRYGTISIERWRRQSLANEAQRNTLLYERKESLARDNAEAASFKPTDIARVVGLEDRVLEAVSDVDELFERRETEFEHNRAFERGILFQGHLDKLMASRIARRNDALRQLEQYRAGLGKLAEKAANEILEAEFEEVGSQPDQSAIPSLAPSKESTPSDIATQDHDEPAQ